MEKNAGIFGQSFGLFILIILKKTLSNKLKRDEKSLNV